MPCRSCGGSGSSASSQFKPKRSDFTLLQKKKKPRIVYMSPAKALALSKYYAQRRAMGVKQRRTLIFT